MRKSVIKSLIWGCLAVMLVSFLIVTIVFFYGVKNSYKVESFNNMRDCVTHVKPIAKLSLDYSTSKMMQLFDISMRQFSNMTKYDLIVATPTGDVVWSSSELKPSQVKPHLEKALKFLPPKGAYKTTGLLDDVYLGPTLTVGEYVHSDYGDKSWAIFCSTRPADTIQYFIDIMMDIMLMELAALLLMTVFLYFFSKNITTPLKKINEALKAFSKGDFSRRVDITSFNELGQVASNVNTMADSIESFESMRKAFVSDVSHELRTPMTSISGFVEGILDGTIPPEEEKKYLEIVLSETKRLSRLVNDLLTASRFDNDRQELQKTSFDLFELAKIVLIKFEKEITEKNINVTIESDDERHVVFADSDAITQVLINLIHNAVKFTNAGGYIKIKLRDENNKCYFTVENSGDGIEKEKLKMIWERFYKTDDSRSTDKSGVGLGLYIVKRIIDSHDESIYVSSDVGKATCFTFTLSLL
ncbi:MAG: HAMP domain-containing histidine kinase [Ruminococcaceae bacterium]|nr:HAMP domain-containing histidine kinase [Oscillospiraceae bacterium]